MITNALIGEMIRQERKAQKMSLQAVGRNLGITWQQVQRYEKGIDRVSALNLYQLAKLHGCSMEYVCDGEFLSEHIRTNNAKNLLTDFYHIRSADTRMYICAIVRIMPAHSE